MVAAFSGVGRSGLSTRWAFPDCRALPTRSSIKTDGSGRAGRHLSERWRSSRNRCFIGNGMYGCNNT